MFDHKIIRLSFLFCFLSALPMPSIVLAADNPAVQASADDFALGQDINRQRAFRPAPGSGSADLLGTRGGYIHPYISLTGLYTDNLYNTSTNEESDFLTTISPGILLAYPGIKDMPGASFSTSNLTPGGLVGARTSGDSFRRFQTSLLYQADIESHTDNSSADRDHQRAEGLFQFNLKGGVSLDLAGEYKLSTTALSSSAPLDEYQSDLIDLIIGFEIGSKVDLALGYTSFQLEYDAAGNINNDRRDRTYMGRLAYKILAKTAIFAEYQVIDVDFDRQVFPDSEVTNSGAGISWHVTSKSSGQFKAGLSSRKHKDVSLEMADTDELFYQLSANHAFTPKTSITLTGTRRLTETTVIGTNYIVNSQASLAYRQAVSRKIVANLAASYGRDSFDQPVTYGTETKKQVDDTILITPSLDYLMKDWFIVSLAYSLIERDSNFDIFDYTTKSVFLRVTGYL